MSAIRRRDVVRRGLGIVAVAIFALAGGGPALAAEVTGAADNLRTGWYPDEPSLAPGQITKERFKQVFKDELHGQIYAQPLVANSTLLVVTEENWAYGLDPITGSVRWEKQLGVAVEAGAETSEKTIKCPDLEPRVGITGTPVIDSEHNVAYFVANRYVSGGSGAIGWYMNAVNLSSGEELPNFPVKIEGEATNLVSEKVKFVPVQQLQRPALLMMNGVVYAAFGSHCDRAPYQGWIVGVSSEGKVVTKWATSSHEASIWQSGGGLVSDVPGQILFSTGNGSSSEPGVWDAPVGPGTQTVPSPEGRLGESVVRVEVKEGGELATKDYFSPFDSKELDEKDLDLGSSAPVALPSPYFGNAKVPHLLVQEGKQGRLYLLNRDALGGREETSNHVVKEIPEVSRNGIFGGAAVWPGEGGYVITPSSSGHLHFFKYGEESGEPTLGSETSSSEEMAFGSGSPIVTSNAVASGSGVLWINWCPKAACQGEDAELRAYSPAGGKEAKPIWQEKIGLATKFSRPGASNGHIYVGNHEGHLISFGFSAKAPTVVSGAASPVAQTSSTLNGSVNPNGAEVGECKFEYGTTTSYGSSAPCTPAPGSGTSPVAVSAVLESLGENTTYHFRIVATGPGGTSFGADQTFTTLLVLGPHWYGNGVILDEGALGADALVWGILTLENSKIGALTCQTLDGGDVANPVGGGAGKGAFDAFTVYDCVAPMCEGVGGKLEVIPEKLEWSALLIEQTGGFRDKLEGIALRVICAASALNVEFHGTLKPKLKAGTLIGAAPSKLEFDATSGSLESVEGAGAVTGTLKVMGFEAAEIVRAKNP
jgi:hypothetical protein